MFNVAIHYNWKCSNLLLSENLMTLLLLLCSWVAITIFNSVLSFSMPSIISRPRKNQWRQCSLHHNYTLAQLKWSSY